MPSEFGCDTTNTKTAALPIFAAGKASVQKVLAEKAKAGSLSYTLVISGPFLDWGLQVGFLLGVKDKKATLYDGGERAFSTTKLSDIGKAVVGVFRNPDQTKNRAVHIQSASPTLKALTEIAKKASGQPEAWTETVVKVDDTLAEAEAELKKENPNPAIFAIKFLHSAIFGEGFGSKFEELDNDLLGVKQLSQAELEELVARYV